jgi:hypothetical protein
MVKSEKIIFLTLFAIVLAAIFIVPIVSADNGNVTLDTTPFITIDPIGNHAIGEVFVIKGTTNLPPVVDTLHILIDPTTFNPAGVGSSFQSTVPIQRGDKDINFWSCTVPTTTGWLNFHEPGMNPTQDARPDHYFVTVESSTDGNISQFQLFNILTADPDTNSTISPTPTPFITIDPIGNHTVGDVFFINGTTNLGRWENTLDLDIEWWASNTAGRWSPMYITNASIQPVGNGTGTWSAEILPAQWEMYTDVEHRTIVFRDVDPGEYVAYAESTSPLGPTVISQQTFFVVPPETTRHADGYNGTQKTGYIPVTGASIPPTPARPADGSDPFMTLLLLVPVLIVLAAVWFFIRK